MKYIDPRWMTIAVDASVFFSIHDCARTDTETCETAKCPAA